MLEDLEQRIEFEMSRRQTVKEQIVRRERLKQWNLADISAECDYIPPKQRIQKLRRLSDEENGSELSAEAHASMENVKEKRLRYQTGLAFAERDNSKLF